MARLQSAALALCCCLGLAAAAGRSLQMTEQDWKSSLQTVDQAAGQVLGQITDAVAASGVIATAVPSSMRNKTIEGINAHAPVWKSDLGYFIRPQACTVLTVLAYCHTLGAIASDGPAHVSSK